MKKQEYLNNILTYLYIFFCAFLMSFYASDNLFRSGCSSTDSSVFRYVAKTIVNGGMPYRDTFDHKGPLLYLINVLGLKINERIGIWLLELVFIFLTFLFVYRIIRLLGGSRITSSTIVSLGILILSHYFEGGNLSEEYSCFFITLSLYFFLKFFGDGSSRAYELILCGASFAAVCLLRINMVALWVVMCIGVLIDRIINKKTADVIRFLLWFLVGAGIVIMPITIWLIKNGAFQAFIKDYFVFNFMYSSDNDRASYIMKIKAVSFFMADIYVILGMAILVYFCAAKGKIQDWLTMLAFAFSIIVVSISGQSYGHYGIVFYPFILYAIGCLLCQIEQFYTILSYREQRALTISYVCLCILLIVAALRPFKNSFDYLQAKVM